MASEAVIYTKKQRLSSSRQNRGLLNYTSGLGLSRDKLQALPSGGGVWRVWARVALDAVREGLTDYHHRADWPLAGLPRDERLERLIIDGLVMLDVEETSSP